MKHIIPLIVDIVETNDNQKRELEHIIEHQSKKIKRFELLLTTVNDDNVDPLSGVIYCDRCDMPYYRKCDNPDYVLTYCGNGCIVPLCDDCVIDRVNVMIKNNPIPGWEHYICKKCSSCKN